MQYIFLLHWKEYISLCPGSLRDLTMRALGLSEVLRCPLHVRANAGCENAFSIGGGKPFLVFCCPKALFCVHGLECNYARL